MPPLRFGPVGAVPARDRHQRDAALDRSRAPSRVIFIDSNVPMYLVGAEHPNKTRSVATAGDLIRNGERPVTDVEV